MTKNEATKILREAAEEGRIKFAESCGVEAFGMQADALLDVLGFHGTWISDLSDLTDFTAHAFELEGLHRKIEEAYGVDVRPENNILAILRKLHAPQGHA